MRLFKKDSSGKLRVLTLEAIDEEVVRVYGVYGGNLTTSSKVCTPKNVGRSNETSGEEQAILEEASDRKKKIRTGYIEVPDDITSEKEILDILENQAVAIPRAMLAKPFKPRYIDWAKGVLCSYKLDGIRCLAAINASEVVLYSRGGKVIETMEHIIVALKEFQAATGFVGILDGELYYHDKYNDNFQSVIKAIKKYRDGISEQVEYHVYETVNTKHIALDRYTKLQWLFSTLPDDSKIKLHHQFQCFDKPTADLVHTRAIAEGYEGTILKPFSGMYVEDKRSSELLKVKDFIENEYKIIDVVPMDNYPTQGKLVLTMGDKTFTATPKMKHSDRVCLLEHRQDIIGNTATIRHFGYTDKGLPRIAIAKNINSSEGLEPFRNICK